MFTKYGEVYVKLIHSKYRKGMAVIMHEKFLCRMVAAPDAYNLTNGTMDDSEISICKP